MQTNKILISTVADAKNAEGDRFDPETDGRKFPRQLRAHPASHFRRLPA
jgi:hypothetical protein